MEGNEVKQYMCRICLIETPSIVDIIVPCLCRGSAKYVHRKCLDDWRSQNPENDNFIRCNECRFHYIIEQIEENPTEEQQRRLRYIVAVTFEILKFIFLFIIIIISAAFILSLVDFRKKFVHLSPFRPWTTYTLVSMGLVIIVMGMIHGNSGLYIYGSDVTTSIITYLFIGLLVSFVEGSKYIKTRMRLKRELIWLRQEAEIYRIKDFGENEVPIPEGYGNREENILPEGQFEAQEIDIMI
jgi:hypothetical protein